MAKRAVAVVAIALAVGVGVGLLAASRHGPHDGAAGDRAVAPERPTHAESGESGPRLHGPASLDELSLAELREEVRQVREENAALRERLAHAVEDAEDRLLARPPDARAVASVETREEPRAGDAGLLRCLVFDRKGRPQAQVPIGLWRVPKEGRKPRSWEPRTTGSEGCVEFEDLLPGAYQINLRPPQGRWMRNVEVRAGHTSEARFWVWGADSGRVRGRVLRHDGEPARGAVVRRGAYATGAYVTYSTEADDGGGYVFESLPPGRCTISASLPLERWKVEHEVDVPARGEIEQDFVLGVPMLHGMATDADTGQSVEGVVLSIQDVRHNRQNPRTRTTGADGRFAFEDLEAATYALWLSRDGYGSGRRKDVRVGAEGRRLDLALQPAATLVFRVRRADGRPFTGKLQVSMRPAGNRITDYGYATISVDEKGTGVYRRIVPGTYDLKLSADTTYWTPTTVKESASLKIEVHPGENEIEVPLQRE